MIVLGLDTSTPATAVALRLADGSVLEARDDPRPDDRPGHTAQLLALADRLLGEAGLGWSSLERIAAGTGPGTFTGLRIGIACARALAQSLGAELTGVSSLRALAHAALDPAAGLAEARAGVLAVIDARRGELFLAAHRRQAGGELLAPCVLSPGQLAEALERAGIDGEEGWLAVGDGAVRYRGALEATGADVPADDSPLHRVTACAVCELGAEAPARAAIEELVPDYLRRPDAELALEAAR